MAEILVKSFSKGVLVDEKSVEVRKRKKRANKAENSSKKEELKQEIKTDSESIES